MRVRVRVETATEGAVPGLAVVAPVDALWAAVTGTAAAAGGGTAAVK